MESSWYPMVWWYPRLQSRTAVPRPGTLQRGWLKSQFSGVIAYRREGAKFQPVFQFAFDDIEAVCGNTVLGGVAEPGPLFFAQIPQGGSQFFARASSQLFQIEERKPRRLMRADSLAIEETKRG